MQKMWEKKKSRLLIIIGIVLMVEGFLAIYHTQINLFPLRYTTIRSLEGMDYVFFTYYQIFLLSGIIGIFVTLAGIILFWRKRK
jgi:hypothetical protein